MSFKTFSGGALCYCKNLVPFACDVHFLVNIRVAQKVVYRFIRISNYKAMAKSVIEIRH